MFCYILLLFLVMPCNPQLHSYRLEMRNLLGSFMKLSECTSARYANNLDDIHRKSYIEKITCSINEKEIILPDQYASHETLEWKDDLALFPPVSYPCLYNYLITSIGPYIGESLRCIESREAYNFYESDHVKALKLRS